MEYLISAFINGFGLFRAVKCIFHLEISLKTINSGHYLAKKISTTVKLSYNYASNKLKFCIDWIEIWIKSALNTAKKEAHNTLIARSA